MIKAILSLVLMWGERIFEGIGHVIILTSLLLHFRGSNPLLNSFMHFGWLCCYIVGAQTEGIRIQQLATSLPHLLYTVTFMLNSGFYRKSFDPFCITNISTWLISSLTFLHHVHHTFVTGAFDFSKMQTKGPHNVGMRRINLTDN